MYTEEQLEAWTKIKMHLMQTAQMVRASIDEAPDHIQVEGRAIIEDIEDNIDIIETMFLI